MRLVLYRNTITWLNPCNYYTKPTLLSHFIDKKIWKYLNHHWTLLCWLRTQTGLRGISGISVLEADLVWVLEFVSPTYKPWSWPQLAVWPWLSGGNRRHVFWENQTGFKLLLHLFPGGVIFSQQLAPFASQLLHLQNVPSPRLQGCWGREMGPAWTVAVLSIIHVAHGHGRVRGAEMDEEKDAVERPSSQDDPWCSLYIQSLRLILLSCSFFLAPQNMMWKTRSRRWIFANSDFTALAPPTKGNTVGPAGVVTY